MALIAQIQFELHGALPVPAGSPARKLASVRAHPGSRPVALPALSNSTLVVREPASRPEFAVVQRPVPTRLLSVHGVRRLPVNEPHSITGPMPSCSTAVAERSNPL